MYGDFRDREYTAVHSAREIEENLRKDISAVNKTLPTFKHRGRFHVRDREVEKDHEKIDQAFCDVGQRRTKAVPQSAKSGTIGQKGE